MKKTTVILALFSLLILEQKTFALGNIDSLISYSKSGNNWYKSARSYYYYTATNLDSIITWTFNQSWYKSGRTYFFNTNNKTDSTHTYTFYQGWYKSGRGHYYYNNLNKVDSIYDYTFYQGWYLGGRSYNKYTNNCLDSTRAYTFYQGWYESSRTKYYAQLNCQIDSARTNSFYQGWYKSGRSFYYYGADLTNIKSSKLTNTYFSISPNPANDILNIDVTSNSKEEAYQEVIITNTLGQTVLKQKITTGHSTLNTSHLKAGVYVVTLNNQSIKLIKE